MPTDYERKTDKDMASPEIYDLASEEVTLRQKSLRDVSPGPSRSNLTEISRCEDPMPCTSSTSDEHPLANSILHDSRTRSSSILNLPATPSQIGYETEDLTKSAENLVINSPDLMMSEKMINTVTMPSTNEDNIIPVASTRKGSQTNRRKAKSAILTDTPVKDEVAVIETPWTAKKKVNIPNFDKVKAKKGKVAKKQRANEDSAEEEESFCICCLEPFSNSRAIENWVQCLECKNWAHDSCTNGELSYVCQNCLSF